RRLYDFVGVDPDWAGRIKDVAVHETASKRVPTALQVRLARTPGAVRVAERVPRRVRVLGRRLLFRSLESVDPRRLEMSTEVEAELRARLTDDVCRLRSELGVDVEAWRFG